jgi:ABC-type sugar transport system substrate-binding protein
MSRWLWTCITTLALLTGLGCAGETKVKRFKMGMMPKITGIAYFKACEVGAKEAAEELDIDLLYDGPDRNDVREQIRMLEQWIAEGYDCIAVAANHPKQICPVLRRARDKGMIVLTFDADADEGRQYFINQASYDDIAHVLLDTMAEEIGSKGKVGILTSTLQAPNQSEWSRRLKEYRASKYPEIEFLPEIEGEENTTLGITRARSLLQAAPDLKGIIGLTSMAFPAAAEAVEQQEKVGQVHVVGLSTPNVMRKYVKRGTVKTVILWKPVDLGYLTVQVADLIRKGQMKERGTIQAGRLKDIQVRANGEVILGPPMKFTAADIDQYDF